MRERRDLRLSEEIWNTGVGREDVRLPADWHTGGRRHDLSTSAIRRGMVPGRIHTAAEKATLSPLEALGALPTLRKHSKAKSVRIEEAAFIPSVPMAKN